MLRSHYFKLQTFIKLEFKLSCINQILSSQAFRRSAETSKLFRQLCVRGTRHGRAVLFERQATARPRGGGLCGAARRPSVVSLQPCQAARYACVACRGLGWYLALVALSKQQALLRHARRYRSGRRARPWATTAGYHGSRLAAHGGGRAASRVSFFYVSRAAVLTCFDGDVNSLVSLQGRRKVLKI